MRTNQNSFLSCSWVLGDKYLNSDTRMMSFNNPVNLDLLPDGVPIKKQSGSKGIK